MRETPWSRFLEEARAFGHRLDRMPPRVPSERGAAAWVLERVQQVMDEAAADGVDLWVADVTVQTAPGEMPQDLEQAWRWPDVELTLDTEPSGLDDPLPPGMCRMWVGLARTPQIVGKFPPGASFDFGEEVYVHGLVPSPEQEERLRRLPDLDLLWKTVDPLPLDAALAKLDPST